MKRALFALLLGGCGAGVSGSSADEARADAGTPECCASLECAQGFSCVDCACRATDCCANLDCEGRGQVCSACLCVDSGEDADADGWLSDQDCDDQDPDVFPGAAETCDGGDEDCDGTIDDDACAQGDCCAGRCVDTASDPDHCGGCATSCDDGDPCTVDRCAAGACTHAGCAAGQRCCEGVCAACCDDGDCDDGDECTIDRCLDGACASASSCGAGELCCDGDCARCCGDGDCGRGEICDAGGCECGPAPHFQIVLGQCRPSCGRALADAGWADDGSGCCGSGCRLGETEPTWDCTHCCQSSQGTPTCL